MRSDVRTLFSLGRELAPTLVYFELTTDLVFKPGGTTSYGEALPIRATNAEGTTWATIGNPSTDPFKVYDPSNEHFAAKGERGIAMYFQKQFLLVETFSHVDWFPCKSSGAGIPGRSIVKVTTSGTVQSKPVMTIAQTDATLTRHYAITSPQGIFDPDEYTVATWRGPAEVSVLSAPPFGQGWGPQVSSWQPKRGSFGLSTIYSPTGSGVSRMLGEYPLTTFKGKTVGAINKGASGSVTAWTGALGVESSSGITAASVQNHYANISADKWVTCFWVNDSWHLVAAEC